MNTVMINTEHIYIYIYVYIYVYIHVYLGQPIMLDKA